MKSVEHDIRAFLLIMRDYLDQVERMLDEDDRSEVDRIRRALHAVFWGMANAYSGGIERALFGMSQEPRRHLGNGAGDDEKRA